MHNDAFRQSMRDMAKQVRQQRRERPPVRRQADRAQQQSMGRRRARSYNQTLDGALGHERTRKLSRQHIELLRTLAGMGTPARQVEILQRNSNLSKGSMPAHMDALLQRGYVVCSLDDGKKFYRYTVADAGLEFLGERETERPD